MFKLRHFFMAKEPAIELDSGGNDVTDLLDPVSDPGDHGEKKKGENQYGGDEHERVTSTPESRGDIILDENGDDVNDPDGKNKEAEDKDDKDKDDKDKDDKDKDDKDKDDKDKDDKDKDDKDKDDKDKDDKEDKGKGKGKGKTVPLARLNKSLEKNKGLQAENDDLKAQLAEAVKAPPTEDKGAKDEGSDAFTEEEFKQMQDFMVDGKSAEAFALMQKMVGGSKPTGDTPLSAEDLRAEIKAEIQADNEQNAVNKIAKDMGEKYPELVFEGDEMDAGMIEEVIELRDAFSEKVSMSEALKKAVKIVALDHELVDRTAKKKEAPKKELDISKKVELSEREKGKLGGESRGKKGKDLDISNLSDAQFGRLSKEAKAKARGDYV